MRRFHRSVALIACLLVAPWNGAYAVDEEEETTTTSSISRDPVIESLLQVIPVGPPVASPDGKRAAYIAQQFDPNSDSMIADIWLVDTATGDTRQLTHTPEGESSVAWHPTEDGITFLSDRHDPDKGESQLWLLPLTGGEARRLTDIEGGISDYHFAPDGTRIAAVVSGKDPFATPEDGGEDATPPPIVIDRFYFKEDGAGYLTSSQSIYLLDAETGEGDALELFGQDPGSPAFSPDGKTLAYVTKTGDEPDRTGHYSVFLIPMADGGAARPAAPSPLSLCGVWGSDRPQWSPDGRLIACIAADLDRDNLYAQSQIALIDVAAGTSRLLTAALDRNAYHPRFDRTGERVLFIVEDDMTEQLAAVATVGGEIERLIDGPLTVVGFDRAAGDDFVLRVGYIDQPHELYRFADNGLNALTDHNAELLEDRSWQGAEPISFASRDGTEVHGLLIKPVDYTAGKRYPTVLWIHGGPTSQFGYEPRTTPQLFAARGYAVLLLNPRGSTGRGVEYSRGIYAAWGSVDVEDVLAGVDHAVAMGIADPQQLVVGGWSYGGMLTNYVIASDTRFQAAASGAAISNVWAGFGTDQYIRDYLSELGTPWDNPENYSRVSYPFMQANRIKTPTLFMVGEKDYNVPLLATEQMYQALQVLRVPTQMVIYPGQSHGLRVPSYKADRWQRYLDWFADYLE